jgi:1-acyl-sn-glycerol-3-phosphate acyltransferase
MTEPTRRDPSRPPFPARGRDPVELQELRESVAALREYLDERARSKAAGFGLGDAAEWVGDLGRAVIDRVASIDLMDLFEELRGQLGSASREERAAEVDEFGMDRAYLDRRRGVLDFLLERWWRVDVNGVEAIPAEGPVLFVANRSGVLPYDGLMISHAVERERPSLGRPRFLVADWLVTLPFSQSALARLGGVRACQENAERLLRSGKSVVAFPEGQKGALKPFRDRYRLQRFGRGGFVPLAARRGAAIVPVAVVGAEEVHPILFRPGIARRLLGVPLPITPTFPHLGPLGLIPLPTQWRIRFGTPVRFDGVGSSEVDDPLYVNRTREQIRGTIQSLVEEEVHQRASIWS